MVKHLDFWLWRQNIALLFWNFKTLPSPKRKNSFGLWDLQQLTGQMAPGKEILIRCLCRMNFNNSGLFCQRTKLLPIPIPATPSLGSQHGTLVPFPAVVKASPCWAQLCTSNGSLSIRTAHRNLQPPSLSSSRYLGIAQKKRCGTFWRKYRSTIECTICSLLHGCGQENPTSIPI